MKFELGETFDRHFKAKFHGESNGDSPDVQQCCLDPEMVHKALLEPKIEKF